MKVNVNEWLTLLLFKSKGRYYEEFFLIKDAAIADHFAYEFRTLIYKKKRRISFLYHF